ncbi:maleylpyruvate isomerase mycothiol-dependent enzyme family protein [Streptomyces sp. S6]
MARHQLQELAVHTYDAQLALGKAEPLNSRIAVDGVHEFLTTCCATSSPWPHTPATLDFRTLEGETWRLTLSDEGARAGVPDETPATAGVEEAAGTVVLWMYNRVGLEGLEIAGELEVFERLRDWDPEA